MKIINRTVNKQGLREIAEWMADHYMKAVESGLGIDYFTEDVLRAWAADAEFQMSEGNPPVIELAARRSISGRAETYTISNGGIDEEVVDGGEDEE